MLEARVQVSKSKADLYRFQRKKAIQVQLLQMRPHQTPHRPWQSPLRRSLAHYKKCKAIGMRCFLFFIQPVNVTLDRPIFERKNTGLLLDHRWPKYLWHYILELSIQKGQTTFTQAASIVDATAHVWARKRAQITNWIIYLFLRIWDSNDM